MKKKQKDDILGEEESDLPVNEGRLMNAKRTRQGTDHFVYQFLEAVRTRLVNPRKPTSTSCRPEVQTNRPHLSSRYVVDCSLTSVRY